MCNLAGYIHILGYCLVCLINKVYTEFGQTVFYIKRFRMIGWFKYSNMIVISKVSPSNY